MWSLVSKKLPRSASIRHYPTPAAYLVATMGTRHSFAPLKSSNDTTNVNDDRMQLKGIVFDMDGTLCKDFPPRFPLLK